AQIEVKTAQGAPMLLVVVKGAVVRPGAYSVPPGSVIASAIVAAGGPSSSANLGALNLQQPLRQGMTVTVPGKGAPPANAAREAREPRSPLPKQEAPAPVQAEVPKAAVTPVPVPATPGAVNINAATLEQLQGIPEIGPSLATRIIAYRKEVGAFRAPEQLLDVKGITPEKFSVIQSHIRTN
ncbi:MAG: ComEA family DNA-binding protein, partial [Armatimonadota bacterium]